MYQTVHYSDDVFGNIIIQALQAHDIDLEGACKEYQTLKLQYTRELSDFSTADLELFEKNAYVKAKDDFQILLNRISPAIPELKKVKNLGANLLDNINLKIKAAEKANTAFDYKYHAGLFNLACLLLSNPNDIFLHIAFRQHIGHHPDETPSCGYKVGGILMMLFGAIVTAAAAIVAIFGFPTGTPLYVSLPVAGVGIGMIATGIALFCHGKNKGLPGTLNQFVDEVDKHKGQQLVESTLETDEFAKGPGSYNAEPSASFVGL